LLEGEKKVAELEKELQSRSTTILHALKEQEKIEIITKYSGTYKLTQLGILEAQTCKMYLLSQSTLKKHKNFWLTHDISNIPPTLLMKIGYLEDSVLIKSTGVDLQMVHDHLIDLLLPSKTIIGISPIFHPDYVATFREILALGGNVDLIVTQEVLKKLNQTDIKQMNKYTSEGHLQVYLNDNIKFASTVTEKNWTLGLFNLSGEYDYTNDLIGNGEQGIEWGHQLFKKTLKTSTKV
jgi:predicted transcriptional regulator